MSNFVLMRIAFCRGVGMHTLLVPAVICSPIITENYGIFTEFDTLIKRPTVIMSRKKHLDIDLTLVFVTRL